MDRFARDVPLRSSYGQTEGGSNTGELAVAGLFLCKRYLWGSAIATIAALPLWGSPVTAMFQRLETKTKIPCHHQLTRIHDISYQCWQFEDPKAKLPVWKYSLGFEFGKLTRSQWQQIAIAYASWRTSDSILENPVLPPYDPDNNYWLMDFMPPIMQATNRHRFIRHDATSGVNHLPASIIANCWGTLYEILRLRQASPEKPAYLMMVDPHTILTSLEKLSTPVDSPEPGDILLISHQHPINRTLKNSVATHPVPPYSAQTYLDHTALFIDKGLIFEKAGAGSHVPYRLIGLSTLQRIWRKDVFDHQIRRPIADPAMPYPLSFGIETKTMPITVIADTDPESRHQQIYSIFPLPPLIEANGRAKLPPQLFEPNYYKTNFSHSAP